MRHILFDRGPRTVACGPLPPAEPSPPVSRRLLSINLALQLSGAPPPDTASQILLARYVAGQISLADILPLLWQG